MPLELLLLIAVLGGLFWIVCLGHMLGAIPPLYEGGL